MTARVLIDATPLAGPAALHGIGRYVADLLVGLAAIAPEWRDDLSLSAVGRVTFGGRATQSADLAGLADELIAAARRSSNRLKLERWSGFARAARRAAVDLVHFTHPRALPPWLGLPALVTCHDLILRRFPREYLGGRVAELLEAGKDIQRYLLATRIAAISEKTRRDLVAFGANPARVLVVPNGVALARWAEPRAAPRGPAVGAAPAAPYLVYVGDADARKNVGGMLAVLARVRRALDVRLVWAGALGARSLAAVRALAREHGVETALELRGFVPDDELAALYRGARALLFLSRLEGFGLPVVEAMAAGCPVIAAADSGSDEIGGEAAWIVGADDHEAATHAVLTLCRDDAERERLANAGRARAGRFSREAMARGYVDAYRQCLGLRVAAR